MNILDWMDTLVWSWMLVFLRASAFLLVLPLFSLKQMPASVRVAVAALIAYIITSSNPVAFPRPTFWLDTILLMGVEIGIGLLMGFFIRIIFYGFEMAGNIISMETGLSMATMLNPSSGQNAPIFSSVMFYFSVLIFLALDLHHEVLAGFFYSYNVLPVGGFEINDDLAQAVIYRSVKMFWVALEMAAPIICVSFTVTLMFAVFGRAVPQMNVFILSFPIRVMAGMVVFGLSATLFFGYIQGYISTLPSDITNLVHLMSGNG